MKEPHKVVLVAVGLSFVLWFSVYQFMNSTHNFAKGLDVRDVVYVEPEKVAEAPKPVQEVRELSRTERRERDQTAERVREQQANLLRDSAAPKAPIAPDRELGPAAMTVVSPEVVLADETAAAAERQDPEVESSRADSDSDIRAIAAVEEGLESDSQPAEVLASGQVVDERAGNAESREADAGDRPSATDRTGVDDADDQEQALAGTSPRSVTSMNRVVEPDTLRRLDTQLVSAKPLTRAVDVRLSTQARAGCAAAVDAPPRVGVFFRESSAAIRGESLSRIDKLIRLWKACGEGELVISSNPQENNDDDDVLSVRREEEVKYYLLQRSVPKDLIVYGSQR